MKTVDKMTYEEIQDIFDVTLIHDNKLNQYIFDNYVYLIDSLMKKIILNKENFISFNDLKKEKPELYQWYIDIFIKDERYGDGSFFFKLNCLDGLFWVSKEDWEIIDIPEE